MTKMSANPNSVARIQIGAHFILSATPADYPGLTFCQQKAYTKE
jgi:hypothetical protein